MTFLFFDFPTAGIHHNVSGYSPMCAGWPVFVGTEPVYHPMEKRSPDNLNDEFIVKNPTQEGVCGGKRKREENLKDTSIVVLYGDSKKEKFESGDLDKQRRLPYSDCNAGQVQETGTFLSKVVTNPKSKLQDSASVDSSE